MDNPKNIKSVVKLPIFLSVAVSLGILIGANVVDGSLERKSQSGAARFREIINLIDRNYVDQVNTDSLVDIAVTEMLKALDPHTAYIPVKDIEITRSELQGNFEGIGIEFNIIKDTICVVTPLSGGPSERIGLLSGDKIVKVDTELVAGIGINNRGVLDKLRGAKGSKVLVSVKRRGELGLLDFEIERDKIPQFSLDVAMMIGPSTGYIKINRFSINTDDEFFAAIKLLKKQGMNELVLDLTSNPGGYLDVAVNMADELLSKDQMIVFTKGNSLGTSTEYKARKKGQFEHGKLIIMIDEGSASASEILAGAVQDNDRGIIVGRRSFGKGLVQSQEMLSDGSELRLTISRYYTPSGRCIQKPYINQKSHYEDDYANRFDRGELFIKDSIKIDTSLMYKTSSGRKVYGGGGINPDIFVPLDTNSLVNRLYRTNTFNEYSLIFNQRNKEELKKITLEEFKTDYQLTPDDLNEFVVLAKENGVSITVNVLKDNIKAEAVLKAQIARGIWGDEGFYAVFNEVDPIFIAARKTMRKSDF